MKNRGITLFIAVVVMGILLFISFAVVNIAVKSSLFSSSGRDSQYAFYAADAGAECAFYWDSKFDAFATSTSGGAGDALTFTCAGSPDINSGQAIAGTSTISLIGGTVANPTSTFGFVMNQGSNPVNSCAVVTVRKYYSGSNLMTRVESRGYNTCNSSLRRLERGIEVTY
jgi:Tfp pilus assembly protein PilX